MGLPHPTMVRWDSRGGLARSSDCYSAYAGRHDRREMGVSRGGDSSLSPPASRGECGSSAAHTGISSERMRTSSYPHSIGRMRSIRAWRDGYDTAPPPATAESPNAPPRIRGGALPREGASRSQSCSARGQRRVPQSSGAGGLSQKGRRARDGGARPDSRGAHHRDAAAPQGAQPSTSR